MDLTIRDWMVIVGVLLILAVLADAWRRVHKEHRAAVRLKLTDPDELPEPEVGRDIDLAWLKELPNGGARVVDRSDLDTAMEDDPAEAEEDTAAEAADVAQPPRKESRHGERPPAAPADSGRYREPPRKPGSTPPPPDEVELLTGMTSRDEPENLDWLDALDAESQQPRREVKPKPAPGRLPREVEPEVFMLNVVARKPLGFRGDDILHILLACDLRFGDMNFFHRHEFEAGRGAIQFSVANMMQPGVFDIDNMSDFSTNGLVFFVTLPGPEDMMKAFDYMLETARAVARNLEGDVLDETRSVLTKQTLEHSRQQIRDLERRLLTRAR